MPSINEVLMHTIIGFYILNTAIYKYNMFLVFSFSKYGLKKKRVDTCKTKSDACPKDYFSIVPFKI